MSTDKTFKTAREQSARVRAKWGGVFQPTRAQTREALEDSIAHWKRMKTVRFEDRAQIDPDLKPESPGGEQCALCQLFCAHGGVCVGCPVKLKSGASMCDDTPFWSASGTWHNAQRWEKEWPPAAQKEIDFLESLLPSYQDAG